MVASMARACRTLFCFALPRAALYVTHGSRIAYKLPLTGADALASRQPGARLAVVGAVVRRLRASRGPGTRKRLFVAAALTTSTRVFPHKKTENHVDQPVRWRL